MIDPSQQIEIEQLKTQIQESEKTHSKELEKLEAAYQQEKQKLEQQLQQEFSLVSLAETLTDSTCETLLS